MLRKMLNCRWVRLISFNKIMFQLNKCNNSLVELFFILIQKIMMNLERR